MEKLTAGHRWIVRNALKACCAGSMIAMSGSLVEAEINAVDKSLVQREIKRRAGLLKQAQEWVTQGDEAYHSAQFDAAVSAYSQAFNAIPKAGLTHELRYAVADRYAKAATESAKVLANNGQYEEAAKLLERVLEDDVAPWSSEALKLQKQLDDPQRFNPALSQETVEEINSVSKWLRKAEGYYDLGQFDEAIAAYEEVLVIDRYNKAAKRGMEKVDQQISLYADSARDSARSELLADVDAQWELPVPPNNDEELQKMAAAQDALSREVEVRGHQLRQTVIPVVDLDGVSLDEALDMVRVWSREYDVTTADRTERGVNVVLRIGDRNGEWAKRILSKKITLNVKQMPLNVVLDHICQASSTRWHLDDHAVIISPLGSDSSTMVRRSFRVPPSFMKDAVATEEVASDIFADDSNAGVGNLAATMSAQTFFEKMGVSFPEGASASYVKANNSLLVVNTPANIDLIEGYVNGVVSEEAKNIIVRLTVVDVRQENLEELGFDVLLDPQKLSSSFFLGGGTQGSGDLVNPVVNAGGGASFNGAPVTSGLRSGDTKYIANSIDDRIAGIGDPGTAGASVFRAPGTLQVTGNVGERAFQTIMRGLDQKKEIAKVWRQSVVTRPGERAVIYSGREMIYPTEYEPGEIPNTVRTGGDGQQMVPATPTHPTAFETRNLGAIFEVEPTIGDDGHTIDLRFTPTFDEFDGFVNYGSPLTAPQLNNLGQVEVVRLLDNEVLMPVFSRITTNTSLSIYDGHHVVVGGLLKESVQEVDDSVPVLGDLPIVGRFFQNTGPRPNKRAIVIFVSAEIRDPGGQ